MAKNSFVVEVTLCLTDANFLKVFSTGPMLWLPKQLLCKQTSDLYGFLLLAYILKSRHR